MAMDKNLLFEEITAFLEDEGYKLVDREDFKYLTARYYKKEILGCVYVAIVKKYSTSMTLVLIGRYVSGATFFVRCEFNTEDKKIYMEKGWLNNKVGEDLISFDDEYNLILGFLMENGYDIDSVKYMDDWFIDYYSEDFERITKLSVQQKGKAQVERIVVEIR